MEGEAFRNQLSPLFLMKIIRECGFRSCGQIGLLTLHLELHSSTHLAQVDSYKLTSKGLAGFYHTSGEQTRVHLLC